MRQPKLISFIETCTHTFIGFLFGLGMQLIVYPMYGIKADMRQNTEIALIFMFASMFRGYLVRRWFDRYLHRLLGDDNAKS